MADYRLCDVCGQKAFYDANLPYDELSERSDIGLGCVGDWAVICQQCAKTHRIKIEPCGEHQQRDNDEA